MYHTIPLTIAHLVDISFPLPTLVSKYFTSYSYEENKYEEDGSEYNSYVIDSQSPVIYAEIDQGFG